jgi:prepilin-type N-terminal cleavage/methylation domain-containing protein
MITRSVGRRRAFTLLELMVVISIMVVLATLAVLFLPNLDRNKGVPNAVTQIHGWFNISKQTAIRDGSARGIRLIEDSPGSGRVVEMQYIEQPEPVAPRGPGIKIYVRTEQCYDPLIFPNTTTNPGNIGFLTVVTLFQDPNNTYTPSYLVPPPQNLWINWDGVEPGDTFQLTSSPNAVAGIRRFTSPPPAATAPPIPTGPAKYAQLVLDRIIDGAEVFPNPSPPPPVTGNVWTSSNNFRVIRQPRPLVGEPTLQLHRDVYIDLTRSSPCQPYLTPAFGAALGQPSSAWAPARLTDPVGALGGNLDILFNPNSFVANCPAGQIVLWVQHAERQGSPQQTGGGVNGNDALLLVIYTRTGKIGAHLVYDVGGFSPYANVWSGSTPGL